MDRLYMMATNREAFRNAKLHGSRGSGYKTNAYRHLSPYEVECTIRVVEVRRARFKFAATDTWPKEYLPYRSVCGAKLYVRLMRFDKSSPIVDVDKWEALARVTTLPPGADIELQYVG